MPGLWHESVVRFSPLLLIFVVLVLAGCSTPQKRQQREAAREARENSVALDQRRRLAIENGEVSSLRGAQIYMPDPNRAYDPSRHGGSDTHSFATKGTATKSFDADRQLRLDAYQARNFSDTKSTLAAQRKYATRDANTHGFLLPDKNPGDKTVATKQVWDAHKGAPSRESSDARRQFLGPESKKMNQSIDQKTLANWRSGETVVTSDGTVEKCSTLKELSIDDIRDLLNKSK